VIIVTQIMLHSEIICQLSASACHSQLFTALEKSPISVTQRVPKFKKGSRWLIRKCFTLSEDGKGPKIYKVVVIGRGDQGHRHSIGSTVR